MPRLAVNMMVLNGASVLRRCLLPLKGVVDELVVADTGSTDGTREVLEEIASAMGLARYRYERLHPCSPSFITDEPETWRTPLPGPFTGARLPRDWAAVRNGLLDETTADYVLKLDADDEVTSPPGNWLGTCDMLDSRTDLDVVSCPYEICDGVGRVVWLSMYERLWRRARPGLRWAMPCHEGLSGKAPGSAVYAAGGLRVRDHRDSPGEHVRVAHRNLKVLLRAWEEAQDRRSVGFGKLGGRFATSLTETFTLAHEAAEVLPDFARGLLLDVAGAVGTADPGMLSDCHYHLGRAREASSRDPAFLNLVSQRLDEASYHYRRACEVRPNLQALLRLRALHLRRGEAREAERVRCTIVSSCGGPIGSLQFNCDLVLLAEARAREVSPMNETTGSP